jgi:hypothetical protein
MLGVGRNLGLFGVTSMRPARGWFRGVFRGGVVVRKLLINFGFCRDFAEFLATL